MANLSRNQGINPPRIYCEPSNPFKNTIYPRSHRLLQYAFLKIGGWHVAISSISHYSFPWWKNGAWALETWKPKAWKARSPIFLLDMMQSWKKCIWCGVHQSALHLSFIRSAFRKRSCDNKIQFHWLLWIHQVKNLCSWHTQNGWIWKPFAMFFASNIAL